MIHPAGSVEPSCLRLAENAVKRGATDRALALGHATTRFGDDHYAFEIALFLALHAIGVAFVGLCHVVLLVLDSMPAPPGGLDVMTLQARKRDVRGLARTFARFCRVSG
jgi:hypothetical protein